MAAHVFVADVTSPELADEDRHHLERVLRVRAGEAITVSDGLGGWRACTYRAGALVPDGEVERRPPLPVALAAYTTEALFLSAVRGAALIAVIAAVAFVLAR